ncbi:MAG: MBL fold metallo-hydrolase [Salinirussus sp.]
MQRGDCYRVDGTDVSYVDVGVHDVPGYGAVYLIDAERPAVVETGTGSHPEVVLDALEWAGIDPDDLAVIAVTHVHLDHAGGAGRLAQACPAADVYVPERGASHLADPARLWAGTKRTVGDLAQFYAEPVPVPEERLVPVGDGDGIDLGDRELGVHGAPGHAPHQAVLSDPATEGVFVADAAGVCTPLVDGVGPVTPPPSFDLDACLDDVGTIKSLDPDRLYYSHFGVSPAAGQLDAYADTLRSWVEAVEGARADLPDDEAVVDSFVADAEPETDAWTRQKVREDTRMNVEGVLRYLDERR